MKYQTKAVRSAFFSWDSINALRILVFLGTLLPWALSAVAATAATDESTQLQEVVVTAEKRTENLLDVPVPVAVVDTEALQSADQVRLQDYFMTVPGLTVAPANNGDPILSIRGISTGPNTFANPTVGILVDDVPYGASSGLAGGVFAPDIDPNDLQRIEVLRGPQGTLYGADNIGGLVKFVTVDPTTDRMSGRVQATVSDTENGDGINYGGRAAVNIPVTDTFALRASGFARRDAGYIDNVQTGERGVNWSTTGGGRLTGLWTPTDTFSLKLGATLQDYDSRGASLVNVEPLDSLEQSYIPGTGWTKRQSQVYSALAHAKFEGWDLTSVTGYSIDHYQNSFDNTTATGPLAEPTYGVTGSPLTDDNKTHKFTEELRLTTSFGRHVDWLLGAFYDDESSPFTQHIYAADNATGAIVADTVQFYWTNSYREYAAFTDFTFHIADAFDLQLGGRQSYIRQDYNETDTGPLVQIYDGFPNPVIYPEEITHDRPFTYLVTPQYKLSKDFMLYARFASGYRAGGPNSGGYLFDLPFAYRPDKTRTYELGAKGEMLDHLLTIDTSVYYVDWRDIQLLALSPESIVYYLNGGRAKSEGVEFTLAAHPTRDLTISGWVDWNEAALVDALPPNSTITAPAGQALPLSARWSGSLSLNDNFPLSSNVTGFFAATASYVSSRFAGFFSSTSPPLTLPAFGSGEVRAGAKFGGWEVSLYCNNVTDKRGELAGYTQPPPNSYFLIQPRTVGLTAIKTF